MTRGRWRGSGTFETDGSGFDPAIAGAVIAALVVIGAVRWVIPRFWWLLGTAVAAVAVAFAVVRVLIRCQQRREAVHRQQQPFVQYRAQTVAAPGETREVPTAARPQIAPPVIINQYIFGGDAAEAARRLIPGQSGDPVNEGE